MRLVRWKTVALVASALLLSACTRVVPPDHNPSPTRPSATSVPAGLMPSGDYTVPASLWRPLHLPTVAKGGSCPADQGRTVSKTYGLALGPGPLYPVGLGAQGVLLFGYPPPPGSGWGRTWSGNKVLWVGSPSYSGPVLIRGHQLDGPYALGFSLGTSTARSDLQLPSGKGQDPGGWRGWPSYTRLRAPGCYGYQVDGTNFSTVIVFLAKEVPA